jgi:4-hydroxy-tetrahydrodipicolinate synthase
VPARTVTSLAADTVIKLSQIPNIIGIKEASGNLEEIAKIISSSRKGFLVWSGNDGDTLPMPALGAYGVISVASHLVGKQIRAMIYAYVNSSLPSGYNHINDELRFAVGGKPCAPVHTLH